MGQSPSQDERQKLIAQIQSLYPADSVSDGTAAAGREILLDAICLSWRDLPIEILRHYSYLCQVKERE